MKVFISWSGERSKELAIAIREWMPVVIQSIEPWMSNEDIGAGQRWGHEIADSLDASNFGIVCMTPENKDARWLLFEAGALAKHLKESRVVPLLLGLAARDVEPPLGQFQAKIADHDGIYGLMKSMNSVSDSPLLEDRLIRSFDGQWPELERRISEIPTAPPRAKPSRSSEEVLEELVTTVRGVDLAVSALGERITMMNMLDGFRRIEPDPLMEEGEPFDLSTFDMKRLSPIQHLVLTLRHGLDGSRKRSYAQVATVIDSSPEDVRTIEREALRALRSVRRTPVRPSYRVPKEPQGIDAGPVHEGGASANDGSHSDSVDN